MQTVEEAYELLATELMDFIGDEPWDAAGSVVSILENMTQSNYWRQRGDVVIENDRMPALAVAGPASQAALFLRDTMSQVSGDRVWGLAFTVFPTGKFKLSYDYNRPEGYEESTATTNIEDGINRLTGLGVDVDESNFAWRQRTV